jgi:hypothetical protein
MTWSWLSFAAGYLLGGLSGLVVLGLFVGGSRGEPTSETQVPPREPSQNSVVRLETSNGARKNPTKARRPELSSDRSA